MWDLTNQIDLYQVNNKFTHIQESFPPSHNFSPKLDINNVFQGYIRWCIKTSKCPD